MEIGITTSSAREEYSHSRKRAHEEGVEKKERKKDRKKIFRFVITKMQSDKRAKQTKQLYETANETS